MTYYENKKIDMNLFVDLVQVSNDIIEMTRNIDIIILIGDTPSYITPFIESKRKIYNLAFSNKPYGCLYPPHSLPAINDMNKEDAEKWTNLFVPLIEQENYYFDYLNTNTFLTREFMKENWTKIILIDSSSGSSISGVSIFFNRYIGNIKQDQKCENLEHAIPLKFIQLISYGRNDNTTNIKPQISEKFMDWHNRNYDPKIIIYMGFVCFYHKDEFIYEYYPRMIPFYSKSSWRNNPILLKKGITIINTLRKLYKIHINIMTKDGPLSAVQITVLLKIIKRMPTNELTLKEKKLNKKVIDTSHIKYYKKLFNTIGDKLLHKKYMSDTIMLDYAFSEYLENPKKPYKIFNIEIAEKYQEAFRNINVEHYKYYDHYGTYELDKLDDFLESIGDNDKNILLLVEKFILKLTKKIYNAYERDSAWVTIRVTLPNNDFNIPRWHCDGMFYEKATDDTKYQSKFIFALKGPGTLLCDADKETKKKVLSMNPTIRDKELRVKINNMLKSEKKIQLNNNQGCIFITENNDYCALHSEPDLTESRIFISILPGYSWQIEELKNRWLNK